LVLLVLRPAGSIIVFQHHVVRSLQRFHIESPGSSPCWLNHCVSTPCGSITVAVPRWISCVYSFVGLVFFGFSPLDLSWRPSVQCSYLVPFGSSPCWLDHFVSTPCDSITAAVPRWFSWFLALLARSLCFNTMWFDHCNGYILNPPFLRPAGSITAFQHHVT
jgi:hypothetical protein